MQKIVIKVFILFWGVSVPILALAAEGWDVLKTIQHKRTYTVMDKSSKCYSGELGKIGADSLELMVSEGHTKSLARSEVVRVADVHLESDIVYTTRSSWTDVKAVRLLPTESLQIKLKSGKKSTAKLGDKVEDDGITVKKFGKPVKLMKTEIATIDYIRIKPVSDMAEYYAREGLAFFTPELWAYELHVAPKMSVRLYDSGQPDETSSVKCKPDDPEQGTQK